MNKQFIKDSVGWGVLLWLLGYVLGIVLFMMVPQSSLGWIIMPMGIALTLWVLVKKVKNSPLPYLFNIAIIWTLIAITLDYLLLVKVFKPTDGYYKLDVYLYYGTTFALPLMVGWYRKQKKSRKGNG